MKPPLQGADVLSSRVEGLLHKQAAIPVPLDHERDGYLGTYFIVPKKYGRLQSILNLKFFNKSVAKTRFKMEPLQLIMLAVGPGQWLASLALKDTYFHVPICPSHHKILRFH